MSYLSPELSAVVAELGWRERPNAADAAELIVGDYARGFLILKLEQETQVAQRSLRGGPSLKLRTNDVTAAEKYIAFYAARLLRFRRNLPDRSASVDASAIAPPFKLTADEFRCELAWDDSWADFGVGNEFAAAQFAQYGRGDVGDTLTSILS
ncbi:hypothetical protein ACFT30_06645 [Microbacterium ureisolvens]|uniref:hypothetical protein n=1 Tax=Microbacterium ureisolvens TaxID=2781186 RepID=UPI00363E145E